MPISDAQFPAAPNCFVSTQASSLSSSFVDISLLTLFNLKKTARSFRDCANNNNGALAQIGLRSLEKTPLRESTNLGL